MLIKMSGKNKKKILIITPYFYPEDLSINNFVKELSLDTYDIKIITGMPNYRNFGFYKSYSFLGPYKEKYYSAKIIRLPIIPRFSNGIISIFIFYLIFFLSSFFFIFIYAIYSRNKFSHVMTFCGSPVYVGFLGTIFAKISNCKSSQWVQDIWPEALITSLDIKKDNFILKFIDYLQTLMWKSSDVIICQSELLSNYFKKNFKNKKIVCLNNPVREETESINSIQFSKKGINKTVTYFGNVGNTQNLEIFIDYIKDNKNIIFNICGTGPILKKLKSKYNNFNNIIFHGWIDKIRMKELANKSDFFYLSLKNLGRQNFIFPSKFQTYLNYSKPIIFIGDKNFCELIDVNQLGYSLDINNLENFKHLIKKINNISIDEKINFSKKTYEYFNENFNLKKIVKSFRKDVLND